MSMVKKLLFFLLFLTVNLVNAQDPSGLTLSEARPFCSDSGAQFPNTYDGSTAVETLPDYGCLFPQLRKNPTWYFLKIETSGDLNLKLISYTSNDVRMDTDFIAWGPFSEDAFNEIINNGDGQELTGDTIIGCEKSTSQPFEEDIIINDAIVDEYYIVMITNYSGNEGYSTLEEQNPDDPNTGTTDCFVNDAPTITSIAVTTATEDIAYTYTITTEDVDGDLVTVSAIGLPSWLTLTDNTLSGTPTEGDTGSEITITATDDGDGALTATQTFTIVVTPVNDSPTITSIAVTTATEDIAYTYTITTEDVDGDLVTVSTSGLPSWLTLSGNILSGTPTEGDTGSEITITATDDGDGALTATQIFTIVVTPVNDAPVAVADTATVLEDAAATSIDVLANDTDEEGDPLTLVSVTTSGTGTVTVNGALLEYTPAADFNGAEEVSYTVSDGLLTSAGVLTITVTPVNDSPTITSTAVTTATEDEQYTYTITTEDVDGDVVTVSASGLPSWLTLTDNTLSGTPTEGETGSEITITATDDGDGTLTATQIFTIVVTPVNDSPTITSTAVTTATEDIAYTYTITTEDVDGDVVTVSATGLPSWLTLSGNTLSGTPTEGDTGSEITIIATDDGDGALTATQTFTIVVTPVNDAPTITSIAVTTATEDIAYTYTITTEDVDGDLVTVSAIGLPSWLTLTDNTLSGTPTEGDTGSEITITATDDGDGALTATQTFTIVVTPVNDSPTITSIAVTTATEDIAYTYTITTEDVDGDLVTVSAIGLPSWLTLTDNTLSGTPTEGDTGSEITITATDDGDGALTATQIFTIVVTPVNDAPVAVDDITTVLEDAAATSIDVLANDTDEEGDPLTLVSVTTSGTGTVTVNGALLEYTPAADFNGAEEVSYTVSDGLLTSAGVLTITVTPVNDSPTITSTAVTTATEDEQYTYTITTEDVDGDVVTVSASGLPSWLTLTDNTLSGTPTEGETGSEITITATDDGDGTLTATQIFTIVVTPVNDSPTITSTAVTTATEDIAYTYTITTEDVDGDVVTVSATGLPSWLTLSGNTLSGTPTEGDTGSEITIIATDDGDGALTATQTFTIVVTPVNDAPTITSIAVTTATEDIAYTYTITTEDVDGDLVTVSAIGLPSWLTLTDNTLSGTPTEGDTGSEITITATDDGDGALTATQTFTIVVTPVNDAPTITSIAVTTATEDIAYTYTITTEDVDGDLVTVSTSGLPSWLTLSGNILSGTPTEGDTGSEITITATDDGDGALTATQIFTIVVTPVNDAPVAVADTATVLEDAAATSIDVLANDTDEEGDPLTLVSVTTSGTGTVTVNGALLEYTPAADFNGAEEVSYTVSDGLLTSAGVLTITVTPVNDSPTITSTAVTTATEDEQYTYTITTEDVDGDVVTVSASGLPSWLTLTDNTLSGTPTEGETGSEITITATDDGDGALTATQTFTIVVTPVNDAPVAVADTATVLEDAAATSIDVLANDTDEEGDPLTLVSVTTSGTGTVTVNGALLEYTPAADFNGAEEVSYTVSDGLLTSAGVLTITVTPVNDSPTITSTAVTTATEDEQYTYTITTEDVDGDVVTVSASGLPSWLTLTDNTLSGTPTEGETGSEITITATDDGDGTLTATQIFTIVVTPVNDSPTITSTAVTTATEDIAYTYTITTEDVDGDVVTVSATGLPSWLTLSGNTLSGTPTEGDTGSEITIIATDDGDGALTATQTFTIVVTPVNDAPTITSIAVTTATEDIAYTYTITTEDVDGDLVTVSAIGLPSWLTLTDNTLSGTPTEGDTGSEITITATDDGDGALTATQTFTIVVTPVNDAPTITSIAVTTATEDIAYTYTITTEDVDGDLVTVSTSGLPSWLTLSGNILSGTPTEGETGSEITITATDDGDGALTATQIFTIVVTPVNDAPVAVDDITTVLEDAAATSIDVLANDTDEEGDPLTLVSVTTSGTGTVTVNGALLEYTPAADFNGAEEVSYTVSDGLLTSAGVLTITVTPVNDAPIAIENIASVLENAFMTSIDVISNDIDVDGDMLSLTAVSYSGSGTVVVNVDEFSVDYTPAPNFIGTEVINYSVTDGILSSEGVLKINVITPEEIQITKPELNIPKFFTPNGDGINDTWNIKWNNVSNYRIIEVNIYNRYGKILKKLTSFDNGWDGTYKGKLMPPNDYWVAIKLVPMNETKRIIIETSNFSLIR